MKDTMTTARPMIRPRGAEAAAELLDRRISEMLGCKLMAAPQSGKCTWHRGSTASLGLVERDILAWVLATSIMSSRSGSSLAYSTWFQAAIAEDRLVLADRRRVAAVVESVFGLPERPKSLQHVAGHVAEWLWYLHCQELTSPDRDVLLLEAPKLSVTDGGADGFIVWRSATDGETSFRLWEIKKHEGSQSVGDVVGGAARQLVSEGERYLAQLTGMHSHRNDDVGDICTQLVDFWIDANDRAGLGISVASDTVPAPATAFATLAGRFPQFGQPGQVEGLLLTITDLDQLAFDVRSLLWIVL
ncbi:hypothetical protein GEV27_15955 [Aeromicrobium sp. S22]|uniref:hypothetical protein n=1 Tax=Aeromicrobium sp. S22 TaxID=2662029 RepID=UPI00129DBCBD|nr:hypothetical protein [Aeromicrobium sp. S22]MRK03013.1 hypothetical protein [Aeromicrobium sp. S22]